MESWYVDDFLGWTIYSSPEMLINAMFPSATVKLFSFQTWMKDRWGCHVGLQRIKNLRLVQDRNLFLLCMSQRPSTLPCIQTDSIAVIRPSRLVFVDPSCIRL